MYMRNCFYPSNFDFRSGLVFLITLFQNQFHNSSAFGIGFLKAGNFDIDSSNCFLCNWKTQKISPPQKKNQYRSVFIRTLCPFIKLSPSDRVSKTWSISYETTGRGIERCRKMKEKKREGKVKVSMKQRKKNEK